MTTSPADQLTIRGNADNNKRLLLGYDTTANRASLQSYTAASTTGQLLLNPSGGNVGVNNTAPSVALDVTGTIKASVDLTVAEQVTAGSRVMTRSIEFWTPGNLGALFKAGSGAFPTNSSAAEGEMVLVGNPKLHLATTANNGAAVMTLSGSKVGIGTTTPGFPLSFSNTLGDKIALFGQEGSSYGFGIQSSLLQIHTDTVNNDIAFGYGSSASMTETMRIKGNGRVGIGISSPQYTLDVAGTARVQGKLGVGTTDTTQGAITTTSSGFTSTGTAGNGNTSYARMSYRSDRGGIAFDVFNTGQSPNVWRGFSYDGNNDIDWYSDRKLKKDIVDAEPMLDRLMQVQFRRYRWKDSSDSSMKPEFGVIAQEVEPLFPDLVATGTDGLKTVGYTSFATITAKALQEYKAVNDIALGKLSTQVDEKDAQIQALRDETAALRRELAAKDESLEARLIALERLISKDGTTETVSLRTAKVAE